MHMWPACDHLNCRLALFTEGWGIVTLWLCYLQSMAHIHRAQNNTHTQTCNAYTHILHTLHNQVTNLLLALTPWPSIRSSFLNCSVQWLRETSITFKSTSYDNKVTTKYTTGSEVTHQTNLLDPWFRCVHAVCVCVCVCVYNTGPFGVCPSVVIVRDGHHKQYGTHERAVQWKATSGHACITHDDCTNSASTQVHTGNRPPGSTKVGLQLSVELRV